MKSNVLKVQKHFYHESFQISGYSSNEIKHNQSLFSCQFYSVSHSDKIPFYIKCKIIELHFYCKSVGHELSTKIYEFSEDREQDISQIADAEKFKALLESLLTRIVNLVPN